MFHLIHVVLENEEANITLINFDKTHSTHIVACTVLTLIYKRSQHRDANFTESLQMLILYNIYSMY